MLFSDIDLNLKKALQYRAFQRFIKEKGFVQKRKYFLRSVIDFQMRWTDDKLETDEGNSLDIYRCTLSFNTMQNGKIGFRPMKPGMERTC